MIDIFKPTQFCFTVDANEEDLVDNILNFYDLGYLKYQEPNNKIKYVVSEAPLKIITEIYKKLIFNVRL